MIFTPNFKVNNPGSWDQIHPYKGGEVRTVSLTGLPRSSGWLASHVNGSLYTFMDYLLIAFLGTGASCVYPLLGTRINGWKFCASEVDDVSYRYACDNIKRNNLEENIHGRKSLICLLIYYYYMG